MNDSPLSDVRRRATGSGEGPDSDSRQEELIPQDIPSAFSEEVAQNKASIPADSQTDEEGTDLDLVPDACAASALPQDTGKIHDAIDVNLEALPPRWRNWVVRGIFTWVMIFSFCFIIWLGPVALVLLVYLIQIKCFHEIITIGYAVYKSHDLPWFRTLSWYFLVASNFFFFGESMIQYFGVLMCRETFLGPVITYHRFISFSLYVAGFVGFVCSLKKKYYLKQFTLFGYTHVTLLLIVTQSNLIVQNVFEGLIWFLVPVTMIICNDIMAYMFGFFFGKTPLIKLSPKKTWEGFIGGAISTVVYGVIVSYLLLHFDHFVCPISYDDTTERLSLECERPYEMKLQDYNLPTVVYAIGKVFRQDWRVLHLYPFTLHSISMALFASLIGPFGGFFASGFKRAFKIKDFGDTIPGHGGLVDRFDCQLLMATFVHVYHSSFIKIYSPLKMVQQILAMKPEDQIKVYEKLSEKLVAAGRILK